MPTSTFAASILPKLPCHAIYPTARGLTGFIPPQPNFACMSAAQSGCKRRDSTVDGTVALPFSQNTSEISTIQWRRRRVWCHQINYGTGRMCKVGVPW